MEKCQMTFEICQTLLLKKITYIVTQITLHIIFWAFLLNISFIKVNPTLNSGMALKYASWFFKNLSYITLVGDKWEFQCFENIHSI